MRRAGGAGKISADAGRAIVPSCTLRLAPPRPLPLVTTERSEVSALPDGVLSPADLPGRWTILHTLSRHEKAVAEILRDAGVGYYLPLNTVAYRDACDKRRTKRLPLFPCYVFLRCEPVIAYDVLAVCRKHLCGEPIRVSDQGGLTRDLSNVCTALAAGGVEQWPELVTGRTVRICHGPLRGVEGFIEQRDGRDLLVIRVEMLGQSISVSEVNPEHVEAA